MEKDNRFVIVHFNKDDCSIQDTAQETPTFYDNLTSNFGSAKQICDLLNEFNNENQQLKQSIKQLEQDCDNLIDDNTDYVVEINQMHKENEELKFENDSLRDDAIKFEKECKRLANNLRLTNGDWKYEELMHKKVKEENNKIKQVIQFYYDTTNDDGKQIISDLVDIFELKGVDIEWMKK